MTDDLMLERLSQFRVIQHGKGAPLELGIHGYERNNTFEPVEVRVLVSVKELTTISERIKKGIIKHNSGR